MNAIVNPNFFNRERAKAWSGVETLTAETANQAISLAGLDWRVKTSPVYAEGLSAPIKGAVAVMREDTNTVLGVVGKNYAPVQNSDSLSFFDDIKASLPGMRYVAAGSIAGGRRVWLLADFGGFDAQGGDEVRKQIMLYNSHDGTSALSYVFVPNRVFCNNQIATILHGDKYLQIRHSRSAESRLNSARAVAGIAVKQYDLIEDMYQALAQKPLTSALLTQGLDALYPLVEGGKLVVGRTLTRRTNIRERITELVETGAGIEGRQRNAFSLYNAFTEYMSHHAQANGEEALEGERRWSNNVFGKGAREVAKVVDVLMAA